MMRLSTGKECVDSLRNGQPFKDEEIPFIPEMIQNDLLKLFSRIIKN